MPYLCEKLSESEEKSWTNSLFGLHPRIFDCISFIELRLEYKKSLHRSTSLITLRKIKIKTISPHNLGPIQAYWLSIKNVTLISYTSS